VNLIFNILTRDFSHLAMLRLMGKMYPDNDLVEVEIDFCTAVLLNSACYVAYTGVTGGMCQTSGGCSLC